MTNTNRKARMGATYKNTNFQDKIRINSFRLDFYYEWGNSDSV